MHSYETIFSRLVEISVSYRRDLGYAGKLQLIWIEIFCWWKLALWQNLVEKIFLPKRDNFCHISRTFVLFSATNNRKVDKSYAMVKPWKRLSSFNPFRANVPTNFYFVKFWKALKWVGTWERNGLNYGTKT